MAVKAFTGGDKLQAYLAKMARKVGNPATLQVGWLANAVYPDGTRVAMVAAIHEFGAPKAHIPMRSFFRPMIASKSPHWGLALAKNLKANDYDAAKALELMGEGIKGQLQQAIVDFVGVPLKASTIAAKGFDKQLIDTGHMKDSVDYKVEVA